MSIFGADIGSAASVICRDDGELLRNELGGHRTTSCVATSGSGERLLGEASFSANVRNKASAVGRLATLPYQTLMQTPASRHWPFSHAARADGSGEFELVGSDAPVPGVALLGALLGKLRSTSVGELSTGKPRLSIALMPCSDEEAAFARAALADAATIGGWQLCNISSSAEASAEALARKYPRIADSEAIDVLIVDMGEASTGVTAVRLRAAEAADGWSAEVLAQSGDSCLGCMDFDAAIFDHFSGVVADKYGEVIRAGSRAGFRLLDGCERLRKLLSTMPEAAATVENLVDGVDVPLTFSRDELATVCAPLYSRLRSVLETTSTHEGLQPLASVELCGGGTRMPSVQAVVSEALGGALGEAKFGAKLDDVSIAIGAALLGKVRLPVAAAPEVEGERAAAPPPPPSDAEAASAATFDGFLAEDELTALIAKEVELAAADSALAALSAKRNELEGYVLEARSLRAHSKHGHLIDGGKLEPLLDAAEEWLYSEEGEAAGLPPLEQKLAELKQQVAAIATEFTAALEADKLREEQALEASDAERLREKAAAGEDEDHDTRKLKFPDRMRLVGKNKEEGTELFQGGNYRPAAARYNKALTHAVKFVDLSPDQRSEVDAIKLSLHLNIAMCWLKITDAENHLEQAIRSCGEALQLDDTCVKAYFRRATALEAKKDYEGAKKDLLRASELAPEDKAVKKLTERVEAQIKRQEAKEKKMWSKAFS
mmetsp:Transcript_50356/g.116247  ORF Transcript_50356/g.116247 Transcript_50356/m.116247 type:complete len:719 (-) Transcript_50356:699-2855(-)